MSEPATARAHANIALVKYWGKRDRTLNLPATGSLSVTLDALTTTTTVAFDPALPADVLDLDGGSAPEPAVTRVSAWLDLVRARAGLDARARVTSINDFPTASGLASSASAYAALALAATRAAGLELAPHELSILARRGSGSAARSIFGGFVRMHAGAAPDGSDAHAVPIPVDPPWPLKMIIAVVGTGTAKEHPSRDAMEHTEATSPMYRAWLDCVPGDLAAAEAAIAARDLAGLGRIAEASALAMHATAMAARPPVLYLQPPTIACIEAVWAMRKRGASAWVTIDAGPHVKVLTDARSARRVAAALRAVPGVGKVIDSNLGGPAELVP